MDRRLEDMAWESTIGQWMKAVDLPEGGATLTPAEVRLVEVRDNKARRDDAVKTSVAIYWREDGWKPLLVNTTIKKTLAAMGLAKIGDVIGRPITIHNDHSVSLGSARVGGVRILGAPWLERDLEVEIQPNPRKRPERITLRRTGPKRDVRPVEPPAESLEAWAARRGFALPLVDAALAAAKKPARIGMNPKIVPQAIAWLEGEGKALIAAAADTTDTTTTHQLGD